VYLSGITYEYCVSWTAIDSISLGFRTGLIEDAVYAFDSQNSQLKRKMRRKLIGLNASLIKSDDVQNMVYAKDRKPQMGLVLAQKVFQKN
jgi:nicotinamidase-related amidase